MEIGILGVVVDVIKECIISSNLGSVRGRYLERKLLGFYSRGRWGKGIYIK